MKILLDNVVNIKLPYSMSAGKLPYTQEKIYPIRGIFICCFSKYPWSGRWL